MIYKHKYYLLLILIIFGSFLLKLHYIEIYSTFTDELLSAFVAKSIGNNGIPLLPSGTIYPRAPIHHYLLAIPVSFFGLSYSSIRINSIILGSIVIWITYLFGAKVAGRKVGIFAAFLLALNSIFNQYSLSGRMYMTYTCFYVLSFYFFYEGFIKKRTSFKYLAILFMITSMLSSEAGIIIGPIFIFLYYFYVEKAWYKDRAIILGCIVWILFAYLIYFYRIPGSFNPFTVSSGQTMVKYINQNMNIRSIFYSITYIWRVFDGFLPISFSFFIVMTALVIKKRQVKEHFFLMALLPALIIQSFFLFSRIQNRVVVTLIPFYILACCHLFSTMWFWISSELQKKKSIKELLYKRVKNIFITFATFVIIAAPFIIDKYLIHPGQFPTCLIKPFYDKRAKFNPEPAYFHVKKHLNRKDIIIQTTLEYGFFFIGDGFNYRYLRQKKHVDSSGNYKYVSFNKKSDPYYGSPIIDSAENLHRLMAITGSRIWLILGPKSKWSVGPDLIQFIKDNFQLNYNGKEYKVYLFQE